MKKAPKAKTATRTAIISIKKDGSASLDEIKGSGFVTHAQCVFSDPGRTMMYSETLSREAQSAEPFYGNKTKALGNRLDRVAKALKLEIV
jgi:hypothetical protein